MNPQAQQIPALVQFLPFIMVIAIFYFLIWMPQQKSRKEHEKMLSSLGKNDEVITSSGIHGTIVNVKDDTFIVKIDDNVKIEINKTAVSLLKKKREG